MSQEDSKKKTSAMSSASIRQSFLDFFESKGHTIVPSSSLVPGGDETLLFTNAGMVQFKDVFLGRGSRPYTRVADAQKCMRVAGKHNDLDDVGRDDTHHTFFEMLGNWSFGDYYKQEAISWAWELLTERWGLPKDKLYATCFEDELGEIPKDEEAAAIWRQQAGFPADHVLFFGRDENFWEMAETGPCGPDSEIHLDLGPERCNLQHEPGHECQVNGDCQRYLELWNLVFIQYNRKSADELEPLPSKHVDTGMGFERVVSVLQGVDSNYRTDLFTALLDKIQALAQHSDQERAEQLTPYRVIADHARAAAFLIADGVVPGNTGRNYVCRMIIRRASRFGSYAGFEGPFLSQIAETVIDCYGDFYPELRRSREAIALTITQEEERFARTVEEGVAQLHEELKRLAPSGERLGGERAFELYSTYGLPLEISRDIAAEQGIEVDEDGFRRSMESHREISGGITSEAAMDPEKLDIYRRLLTQLRDSKKLRSEGVEYDPYGPLDLQTEIVGLLRDGGIVQEAHEEAEITVVLARTNFYVESGGQVADRGLLRSSSDPGWEVQIESTSEPLSGLILHHGKVLRGRPAVGAPTIAVVAAERRLDIMRNHTATHLLHAGLRKVLGEHARQAGSLVAPDRLRFDFSHPQPMTPAEIERVERWVNEAILADHPLRIRHQRRQEAVQEGAIALFGETYGDQVRTIAIGDEETISYELCGGTHVRETGAIGLFLITSESGAAAGIRRIEAVTGRAALDQMIALRRQQQALAEELDAAPDKLEERVASLQDRVRELSRTLAGDKLKRASDQFEQLEGQEVDGVYVLSGELPDTPAEIMRELTDRFRNENESGVVVLASAPANRPVLVAAITSDLIDRGLHAGELVRSIAKEVGGGGGGRPDFAQAGGKDPGGIGRALDQVPGWVRRQLE